MICSKCGAPLPPGVSACPYCGAAVTGNAAVPMQGEETAFGPANGDEYAAAMPQEPTEFAGGMEAAAPVPDDEETEFAGAAPGYGAAPAPFTAAPPAPARKGKGKQPKPKKQKPAGKKAPVLRIILIIILVLLIVALVAKPYIANAMDMVFCTLPRAVN